MVKGGLDVVKGSLADRDPLLKLWGRSPAGENSRSGEKAPRGQWWAYGVYLRQYRKQDPSGRVHRLITWGQGQEVRVHSEKTAGLSGCVCTGPWHDMASV